MLQSESQAETPEVGLIVEEEDQSERMVKGTVTQKGGKRGGEGGTYSPNPKEEASAGDLPPGKSRWFSLEFIITYILFLPGYIAMFRTVFAEADEYNSGEKHMEGVVPGWLMGRKMDLADAQWNTLRSNFPLLLAGMVLFLFLSELVKKREGGWRRVVFYDVMSLVFTLILHGTTSVWVFLVAIMNFSITRILDKSRLLPFAIWGFNLSVLWSSYFSHGYRFSEVIGPDYAWLDDYRGLIAWEGYFKISLLRYISYGMDYYWMTTSAPVDIRKGKDPYYNAQKQHLPRSHYDFWNFFAYIFYVPLYIAGPICSFNAWGTQVYTGPQSTSTDTESVSRPRVIKEIIKFFAIFLFFEIWLHYIYSYGINERQIWKDYRSLDLCINAYFVLNFMYLKFLIIWRFFRLVSKFDGIDVPENMNRCVNNNFTFAGFWRSWHASFNIWTLRYLYIPLGGTKSQMWSVWVIFLFIGLWHDLWISWVAWAMINAFCFCLEAVIIFFFNRHFDWLTKKPYWRHMLALIGSLNVFLLMLANLAILHGFTDSAIFLEKAFMDGNGIRTFIICWIMVSFPVLWMQEIREGERRKNLAKRF